ncbi:hypothetical protein QQS21_006748 [Conoideocrella luteorostrata]|uniref:N-acetyltransferase domain-containing protein n=1 Tax=Conoideocrella luteorostrata TaxID=1105319 RepID=A0AAJ0CLZ1_9HYPO|nr:hypothetical protein QQS21_006748 [Conoideocrella luteorostrata]
MHVTVVNVGDAEQLVRKVDFPAMQDGPLFRVMFPNKTITEEEQDEIINWYCDGLKEAIDRPEEHFLQIRDAKGSPLGFCGWTVVDHAEGESVRYERRLGRKNNRHPTPKALDLPSWTSISNDLRMERRQRSGGLSRFCRLTFLSVCPEHQRKGLGSELLRSACQEIDKLGLCAFVMASPSGVGLYGKFGFEAVGKVESPRGVLTSMIRSPSSDSIRNDK